MTARANTQAQTVRKETLAEREILFGPVGDALAGLELAGPVAVLGSERSARIVPDEAFADTEVHRFSGSRAHNPAGAVEEAKRFVAEHGARTVIGIGSASAVDLSKAVAQTYPVRLVAVPTTLGGAEMSRGFGILANGSKAGGRLERPPRIVVYDPSLLATAPAETLGSSGLNCFAHTIEAHYARRAQPLAVAAAASAGRALPELLIAAATPARESEPQLFNAIFEAAYLAGFALDICGMGLHHAICHMLGAITEIPHGIVNAIVLPHAVRANAALAPEAVASVSSAFGIADLAAEAERIARAYGLPGSFAELGCGGELVDRALGRILAEEGALLRNNPAPVDESTVAQVLRRAVGVKAAA